MSEEKMGIEELKEVLKFVIEFGEAADKALLDKKFEISELALLMGPFMLIGPAFEGLDKVGGEIKDLDEAELVELKLFVETELDLANDKVEEIIEKALAIGVQLYGFIKLFAKAPDAPDTPVEA